MIPVSLKIKGLYSYQQEQTIDFKDLLDGQVFGIFGSVGSGKSTILEAISFALYGQTERLNRNDNLKYNMMNLRSNQLEIDFIFENSDSKLYRFTVAGKRNKKRFDDVKTYERIAYEKVNGEWQALEINTAESLLGLSYDNFRRTIIIPQGKFQEFLQLGNTDRTKMLKEIFNLDKFDFSEQAAKLDKNNENNISNIEGQLKQYEKVDQAKIDEQEKKVQRLDENLEQKRKQLEEKEQQEKEQAELKKLFDELRQKRNELEKLKEKEDYYKKLSVKINDFDYCYRHFKAIIDKKIEISADIVKKKKFLDVKKKKNRDLSEQLAKKNEEFEKVGKDYEKLDDYKKEREDHKTILSIISLEDEIMEYFQKIAKEKENIGKLKKQKEDFEGDINEIKEKLDKLKKDRPDMTELSEVRTWFTTKNNILENIKSSENELKQKNSELKQAEEEISEAVPETISDNIKIAEKPEIADIIEKINGLKESNEKAIEKLESEVEHYKLQQKLGEFADEIKDGKPCPLCGSTEHPEVFAVEDVKDKLTQADKKIKALKKENHLFDKTNQKLRDIQSNKSNLEKTVSELKEKLSEQQRKLSGHNEKFKWDNFDPENEKQIDSLLEISKKIEQEIKKLEDKQSKTEKDKEKAERNFEKKKEELNRLENEKTGKESEKGTLLRSLKAMQYDEKRHSREYVKSKSKSLDQTIKDISERYEKLNDEIKDLKEKIANLQGTINTTKQNLAEQKEEFNKAEAQINEKLDESKFETKDQVERILAEELDIEKLRQEINNFEKSLYSAQKELANYENQTKDKSFDEDEYKALVKQLKELKEQVQQLNDTLVKEKASLDKLNEDLKQRKELEKEEEKLKTRRENLKTLKNLFKGNGFVNYVSTLFLQNLCEAANERFEKLTRQQLKLDLTDKNEFQVIDKLNDGRARSVKTLSGGQTFQASLALALALADSIHRQNNSDQNFFFLDEGFGSLDKESLSLVFDTLKSLRKENRVVGVISHVEELQEEIDVYLNIVNDTERGSLIERSWV